MNEKMALFLTLWRIIYAKMALSKQAFKKKKGRPQTL
jgi:hypothetical protein